MTTWTPQVDGRDGPRYLLIANAIESDVAAGRLAAGAQMPTHRELAYRLGVTVGTVTRAYSEARRRGLLTGEVGRGTFVRGPENNVSEFRMSDNDGAGNAIDLRFAIPYVAESGPELRAALAEIANAPDAARLLDYHSGAGLPDHRAAVAEWCARAGENAHPDNVVISAGTQHAISIILMAATMPGDVVLVEDMTFPPFKVLAANLGLRLEPVPLDGEGIDPDALDHLCRTVHPTLLYCMPTHQNPTTATMSPVRREAVVAVARRHGLPIIEDDIYAILQESPPPPLASLAPELVYFVDSTSKGMAPGLRVGFVLAAEHRLDALGRALKATTWMAAPLTADVAARWMRDGTAQRLIDRQREECAARCTIARHTLGPTVLPADGQGCHVWLDLPESWDGQTFAAEAARQGVRILAGNAFAIRRQPPRNGVRIGVGAAPDRESLSRAIAILGGLRAESMDSQLSAVM